MSKSYVEWLRSYVGHRKVYLPFVTVIARDERERVLLQRRTDFDFWGLPGGVLELDEDVETGARRELLEETGLTVGSLRLVGIYTDPRYDVVYPNGDHVQQFTFCLEGRVNGGRMRVDGLETSQQLFASFDESQKYDLPRWYRDMLVEAEMRTRPQFRQPFADAKTTDQIANVRPSIGTALYAGMGASVVLTSEDGKLLMLHHVGEQHWRIPSGFADLGENAAHAAIREVREELGLHIELKRLVGVHATPALNTIYQNGDRVRNVGVVFRARQSGGNLRLDREEILDMAWMASTETLAQVHPSRRSYYHRILECIDNGYFVL